MAKIVLNAEDLDGFLSEEDKRDIKEIEDMYAESMEACQKIKDSGETDQEAIERLCLSAGRIGHRLEEIAKERGRIHVYSFDTPDEMHAECSRIIAKLRDPETGHEEFLILYVGVIILSFIQLAEKHGNELTENRISSNLSHY